MYVKRGYPFSEYFVERKELPDRDKTIITDFLQVLSQKLSISQFCFKHSLNAEELTAFIKEFDPTKRTVILSPEELSLLKDSLKKALGIGDDAAMELVSEIHGYKVIQPLFQDEDLEDIIINGVNDVFVFHRKYGICRTNLSFKNERELGELITQIFPKQEGVFKDVRLADGSRANFVFPPVTKDPVITIRKFHKGVLSLVDLIKLGTMSTELAGFLWTCTDGLLLFPMNMIITGGTGSGKTTTLNALTACIPPSERIISIEEVREIKILSHENWVALEASEEAGINQLLINTLRMRPDRLLVGEIRGEEAETLFTAMNVGHRGVMSTLHANSDRDAITRLESFPMNVQRGIIPLLDLIVVQHRFYHRKKGLIRRITQVSEVSRLEDIIALNEIFHYDISQDLVIRTKVASEIKEKLAKACSISINEVNEEISKRTEILDYLFQKNISKEKEVSEVISKFYEEIMSAYTKE